MDTNKSTNKKLCLGWSAQGYYPSHPPVHHEKAGFPLWVPGSVVVMVMAVPENGEG